jgi:hypothetical protein
MGVRVIVATGVTALYATVCLALLTLLLTMWSLPV